MEDQYKIKMGEMLASQRGLLTAALLLNREALKHSMLPDDKIVKVLNEMTNQILSIKIS